MMTSPLLLLLASSCLAGPQYYRYSPTGAASTYYGHSHGHGYVNYKKPFTAFRPYAFRYIVQSKLHQGDKFLLLHRPISVWPSA